MKRVALRAAREAKGLTGIALAELIGASENHVFDVERGRTKPRRPLVNAWAFTLGLEPQEAFPDLFDVEGRA